MLQPGAGSAAQVALHDSMWRPSRTGNTYRNFNDLVACPETIEAVNHSLLH
jgi:hypothetical protein